MNFRIDSKENGFAISFENHEAALGFCDFLVDVLADYGDDEFDESIFNVLCVIRDGLSVESSCSVVLSPVDMAGFATFLLVVLHNSHDDNLEYSDICDGYEETCSNYAASFAKYASTVDELMTVVKNLTAVPNTIQCSPYEM